MRSSSSSSRSSATTSSRRRSSPRVGAQQPLVLLVGHRVDAPRAAPRGRRSFGPYLTITQCQPAASNIDASRPAAMSGTTRSSDWRLRSTTHMTSPSLRHHRVGDRLPARALVELGVAEQRDLAPADRDVEVPGHVAVRERAPDRRRRADPDRAGRVVDRVGVLGARRVGLQPAELPQRLEVARLEAPEQVVDRVQHRRGVRLDRHAVGRLEEREPQRGHQRHHRRARRLVAADLHARAVRAHVVGVVDDRRREPQHAPLHAVEDGELDGATAARPRCVTVTTPA